MRKSTRQSSESRKDFLAWHVHKEKLHKEASRVFFHEREVWFARVGVNIGFEQDGGRDFGRPVLVLKKFNNEVFWGLPLSTKNKENRFYIPVDLRDSTARSIVLSQLRLFDAKRLYQKLGVLDTTAFTQVQERVIECILEKRLKNVRGDACASPRGRSRLCTNYFMYKQGCQLL